MGKEVAWGRTSQRAGEKTHVGVPLGRTHISCPMSSVMKRTYSGKKTMLFPLLEKCINHRPRKRKPFSQALSNNTGTGGGRNACLDGVNQSETAIW